MWSYVLALGGACGFFMMRRGMWQGFAVSTGMQFLWLAYTVASGQWGFLFGVFLYGPISAWGWYTWKRGTVRAPVTPCSCPCACGVRKGPV